MPPSRICLKRDKDHHPRTDRTLRQQACRCGVFLFLPTPSMPRIEAPGPNAYFWVLHFFAGKAGTEPFST